MDQVTLTKNQLKFQHWAQLINQYQQSGMTITAWCEQNHVSKKSFYYWLRKIRENAIENSPVPVCNNLKPQETEFAFKPLEIKTPIAGMQAAVVIHLPNADVEIVNGADQQTVEAVLLALKSIC